MNRNIFLPITAIFVLGLGVLFFVNKQNDGLQPRLDNNRLSVSASFYPLYYFASEIGGNNAQVTNLSKDGVEPHDFEPSPADIARMQESKLLFVNGAGLEPWVEKLQDELKQKGVLVVTATQGLELLESADPHVWLSPVLAKSQIDKLLQGYIQVDPGNRNFYEANAEELKRKLTELDSKFKQGLASCRQKSFVTSHAAFGYLAREYNLTQVPISGISPDEEPSPAEMAEVTKFARELNVKYIFFEILVSPKLSETIAKEIGAQTLVLDPIEGLSDDTIRQGKNYFTVMESNLLNLQTALECSK